MPEDVREAFADAVRLFNRWKSQPLDVPGPPRLIFDSWRFRSAESAISVTAYKSEPMPVLSMTSCGGSSKT